MPKPRQGNRVENPPFEGNEKIRCVATAIHFAIQAIEVAKGYFGRASEEEQAKMHTHGVDECIKEAAGELAFLAAVLPRAKGTIDLSGLERELGPQWREEEGKCLPTIFQCPPGYSTALTLLKWAVMWGGWAVDDLGKDWYGTPLDGLDQILNFIRDIFDNTGCELSPDGAERLRQRVIDATGVDLWPDEEENEVDESQP